MTLDEYAKHMAKTYPVVWIDGVPWRTTRRMLEPLAAPHTMKPVDRTKVRQAIRETGALLARWNDAWDTAPGEWWWLCADDPNYDVEKFPSSRGRRDVRAGLRRCEVQQVDIHWMANRGYEPYAAAMNRYGSQPKSRESFAAGIMEMDMAGSEWWACLVDGEPASWAHLIVVENTAYLSGSKSDPKHYKARPNNAMCYVLTKKYLCNRGIKYITDGVRVLLHETQFQDFLEDMGYRRIYCPLRVELSPLAALAIGSGLGRWGRYVGLGKLAPARLAQLQAAMRLVQVARACRAPAQAQPAAAQAQPARGREAADDPAAPGSEGDVGD